MKAKTKRQIRHILTKKKLAKKKTSRHLLRTFIVVLATICTGSLAYAVAVTRPSINVAVRSTGPDGRVINAPATPTPPPVAAPAATAAPALTGGGQSGRGSWYALGLPQPDALTCASRTYPRGSHLHVKNLSNGRTITCRVNDYGPEAWTGRIIDLSRGSFRELDNLGRGTIPVEVHLASGQSGYTLPINGDIAAIIGYNLCHKRYSSQYCEEHRQEQ